MAKTKASTRRPKSVLEQDRYTAELSTGQLVIGVCILLMFGLGCFLLGVLIGKFDPSLRDDAVAQRTVPAEAAPATTAPPEATAATTGTSGAAAQATTPPAPPPEMRVPPAVLDQDEPAEPAPSGNNEEDAAQESEAPGVGASVKTAAQERRLPPADAQPEAAAPVEEAEPERPEAPDTSQQQVAQAGADTTPTAPPEPEAAPTSPAPEQATERTRFAVQIAAFETPTRAEVSKQQLEAKSSYQAQIVTSASGRLYKVVVGSYADRATANQVRTDLRTRYRYSDCFVTTLQ